jgi:hypothetical protein
MEKWESAFAAQSGQIHFTDDEICICGKAAHCYFNTMPLTAIAIGK